MTSTRDKKISEVAIKGGLVELSDPKTKKSEKSDMENSGKKGNATKLETIKDRYMSSFTIHALNHIVEGSFPEKVMWSLKLVLALGVAVYLAWHIFIAYFAYEVSTTIKSVSLSSMRLPMVYVCGEGYNRYLMTNLHNCLEGKKYYNTKFCTNLRHDKPDWYKDGAKYCGDNEDNEHICIRNEPLLMNQCIVINPNLKFVQTDSTEYMIKDLFIPIPPNRNNNANDGTADRPFPLHVWINPSEASWQWGAGTHYARIDGPGKYEFALEESSIHRLPAPYSKPSCIQQGSQEALEKNILIGEYSERKCEDSCILKHRWLKCGVVPYVYRNFVRDKDYLSQYLNESIDPNSEEKSCWEMENPRSGPIWKNIRKCTATCYQPCQDGNLKINVVRYSWRTQVQKKFERQGVHRVQLTLYYRKLMRTEIRERPSFDEMTLLANFGGMLGLMTGMSALSIIEILIWTVLCIVVCVQHR